MVEPQFINCAGVTLAYYEFNREQRKLVFFVHGNSISSRTWKRQFVDPVFSDYRLIAIDLPGHGHSGEFPSPSAGYTIPALGATVAAAIKILADDLPFAIIATSLGTSITAEALKYNVKATGLVLAGPCIAGGKYRLESFVKPGTAVGVVFTEEATVFEVQQYASEVMLNTDSEIHREFLEDYFSVKPHFRVALADSIQENKYNDQLELIKGADIPVLVIFGKDEMVINPDYLDFPPFKLWQGRVIKLLNASHLVHIDQPSLFNLVVHRYFEDRFK